MTFRDGLMLGFFAGVLAGIILSGLIIRGVI